MNNKERLQALINEGEELVKIGNLKEAKEIFLEALKIDPENPEIWSDLSYILYLQGSYKDALTLAKVAFSLEPENETYRENFSVLEKLIESQTILSCVSSDNVAVSIIIPVYNRWDLTKKCITSIYAHTDFDRPFEIVIVDNGSNERVQECLSDMLTLYHNLRFIRNEKNLGFAKACNQGSEIARGEFLLFLNNDTEVIEKDWLSNLLRVLEEDESVGCVGAKLLFPDRTIQHAGVIIVWDEGRGHLGGMHTLYRCPEDYYYAIIPRLCTAVTGACLLVRKSVFQSVGGFDEIYWNGNEDVDLCLKIREKGLKVVYEPSCVLLHHESQSGIERWTGTGKNVEILTERWAKKVKPDVVIDKDGSTKKSFINIQPYFKKREGISVQSVSISCESFSSIVIPARDWEYTRACLESIVRFTDLPYELIVVDNGSEKPLFESLSAWKGRNQKVGLIYVRTNKNLGFSGGVNRGLLFAKGDFIVVLNNDTLVTPNWLSLLISSFSFAEDIGLVVPVSNYIYGPQMISNCPLNFEDPYKVDFGKLVAYAEKVKKENKDTGFFNEFITALLLVIKRKLIEEIGGFDERFFPGNFEDDDFCVRTRLKGLKIFVRQDVFIYHFGGRTFIKDRVDYQRVLEENFERFKKKWNIREVKTKEELYKKALINGGELYTPLLKEGSSIVIELGKRWERVFDFYLERKFISSLPLFIANDGKSVKELEDLLEKKNIRNVTINAKDLKTLVRELEGEKILIFSKPEQFIFKEEGIIAVKEL